MFFRRETRPPPTPGLLGAKLAQQSDPRDCALSAVEALRDAFEWTAVAVYVEREGLLFRVALSVGDPASASHANATEKGQPPPARALELNYLDDWEATIPGTKQLNEAKQSEWFIHLGSRVWIWCPEAYKLRQPGVLTSWSGLSQLVLASHELKSQSVQARKQAIEQEVVTEILKASNTLEGAFDILLRACLSALGSEGGLFGKIEGPGKKPVLLTSQGDVSRTLEGISVERLKETWQVLILKQDFLQGARTVWGLAQPHENGAVFVVAASRQMVSEVEADANTRLRKLLTLLARFVDSQSVFSRHRSRLEDLLNALASLAEDVQPKVGHTKRVRYICELLANSLNVVDSRKADLLRAAELHDVGRLPLHGGGNDTASEFLHPLNGAALAQSLGEPEEVVRWIRLHHERADGLGFPANVSPQETDTPAWILILAEAFVEQEESSNVSWSEFWRKARGRIPPPLHDAWNTSFNSLYPEKIEK